MAKHRAPLLRYAIEKLPQRTRRAYLDGTFW
jgi:hypothetical protein